MQALPAKAMVIIMSEYRLLIVDDEQVTRNGLTHLFDWSKLNVEVVGEADDGMTALPLLDELRPDILFTDVKMVRMDGIELARQAKEKYPDLKIVFLSGYSEVEYVRSALKVGAVDYILKPVDYAEVEQCFQKIIKQIESERCTQAAIRKMEKIEDRLSVELFTMNEHFLLSLLMGQVPTGERLQVYLEGFDLDPEEPFSTAVVVLEPDEGEVAACMGFQGNWPLLSVALRNIANEILGESFKGMAVDDPFVQNRLALVIFLCGTGDLTESISEMCGKLKSLVKKYLYLSVSLGIGRPSPSLHSLKESYDSASEALKHRLYLGGERVIPHDFTPSADGNDLEKGDSSRSLQLLLTEDEVALEKWVDELLSNLKKLRSTDITFYRSQVSRYVFEAHRVLFEQLGEGENGDLSQQSILDQLFHAATLEQMCQLLLQYCKSIQKLIGLKNSPKTAGVIRQVQKVIQERYSEELTVNELAATVYLTPTYLCLLFRQVTGMTINHYQTVVRMEKAKELLQDPSKKLYDISYEVGYMNPSYFSRQFKKYTGCLPSEYRSKMAE